MAEEGKTNNNNKKDPIEVVQFNALEIKLNLNNVKWPEVVGVGCSGGHDSLRTTVKENQLNPGG